MRWPLGRRETAKCATAVSAAAGTASPAAPAAAAPQPRSGHAWTAMPVLRPVISFDPVVIGAPALRMPEVSGTRMLLQRRSVFDTGGQAPDAGRVEGLATVRPFAEPVPGVGDPAGGRDQAPTGEAAGPRERTAAPRAGGRRSRLVHPVAERTASAGPLTQALDQYVGQAQAPAEPYRAPAWLRAAANAPFLAQGDPVAAAAEPEPEPFSWPSSAPGPVLASWNAPEPPARPAPPARAEQAEPEHPAAPRRRRSLGQSRRLGLGTPFTHPPEAPFTSPEPPGSIELSETGAYLDAEADEHAQAEQARGEEAQGDDEEAEGTSATGPPGPAPRQATTTVAARPVPAPTGRPPGGSLLHPRSPVSVPAPPSDEDEGDGGTGAAHAAQQQTPVHQLSAQELTAVAAVYRPAVEGALAALALPRAGTVAIERVPPAVAGTFQSAFGVDVSGVPVHRGPEVSAEAQARGTRAFTRGGAVYLPAEEGALDAAPARAVLGHELVHVVQQRTLGRSLPSERSAQGLALEAQARQAEGLFGAPAAAVRPTLSHPPQVDPAGYAAQIAEELVRLGVAHTDSSGDIHLGAAHFDAVDAGSELTQHLMSQDQLDKIREDFTKIKLEAYAEARDLHRLSRIDDPAIREEDREILRYEIEAWVEASRDKRKDREFLRQVKLDAMRAWHSEHGGDYTNVNKLSQAELAMLEREIDKQVTGFTAYDSENDSSYSGVPIVPDVVGKPEQVAVRQLRREGFTVEVEREMSAEKEGTVIGVVPDEGSYLAKGDPVRLIVSAGRSAHSTARSGLAAMGIGALESLGGVTLGHEKRQQIRKAFGIKSMRDDEREVPETGSSPDEEDEWDVTGQDGPEDASPPPSGTAGRERTMPGGIEAGSHRRPRIGEASAAAPAAAAAEALVWTAAAGFGTQEQTPATTPAGDADAAAAEQLAAETGPGTAQAAPGAAPGGPKAQAASAGTAARSAAGGAGAMARLLEMPDGLVGSDIRVARSKLKKAGITLREDDVTYLPSLDPQGTVLLASPTPGTILSDEGGRQIEPVELHVSDGPRETGRALRQTAGLSAAGWLGSALGVSLTAKDRARLLAKDKSREPDAGQAPWPEGDGFLDETPSFDRLPVTAVPFAEALAAPEPVLVPPDARPRAGAGVAPGVTHLATPAELDDAALNELANRLYDRIRSRFTQELRINRARIGRATDIF